MGHPLTSRAFNRRMAGAGLMRRPARGGGRIENMILKISPYSFVEADYYSIDGVSGKVSAFLDKVRPGTGIKAITPGHAFAQATSANQVVIPTATATLGGRLAANFNAAPYYVSNSPASSWRAAHNGNGFTSFAVFDRTTITGIQRAWSTYTDAAAQGATWVSVSGAPYCAAYNGTTITISANTTGDTTGPTYVGTSIADADTPEATLYRRSSAIATANNTAGFNAGDPVGTMTLGASTNGAQTLNAYVAMWLFFDRVLSAADLAVVRAYIAAKYGVA